MIWRIYTRTLSARYCLLLFIVTLLLVYELKEFYDKYQKETRFSYYKTYVQEIKDYAKKIEVADNKSYIHMQQITKLLKISVVKSEENKVDDGDR